MKSVDTSVKTLLFPNINEDGWKFISISAILSLVFLILWLPLGCVAIGISVWIFYSFRDPDRITPDINDIIVAPADGKVVALTKEKGPDVLGLSNKTFNKISIYSNIFDVNIARIPTKSRVVNVYHDDEVKFSHSLDKNNIGNERMLIALKSSGNRDVAVVQTATFFAPRIKNSLKKGDEFLTGQHFGIIRFGGYTDLYLPEKTSPLVCLGQTLIGGETIVADFNSDAPSINGEIR